jgi:hypothetical protein
MAKLIDSSNNSVKIIRTLGHGVYGVTYLAEYKNEHVLVKKAPIDPSELDDKTSRYNASLAFDKFALKHPEHFMSIIKSDIIEDCKWNFRDEVAALVGNENVPKKDIHRSRYCSFMIMKPVLDDTLKNWYSSIIPDIKTNKPGVRSQVYGFLAQFFYMYRLMENAGWYHADSKWKNIMYAKTEDATISMEIDEKKITIPSHGKRWYLIDYDPMYSESFYKKKLPYIRAVKQIANAKHFYLARILEFLLVQPFWATITKYKIKVDYEDVLAGKLLKREKTKYLKDLLPALDEPDTLNQCVLGLAVMLEPAEYFDVLGLRGSRWESDLQATKNEQYISVDDYKFMIANLADIPKIIGRLVNQLN